MKKLAAFSVVRRRGILVQALCSSRPRRGKQPGDGDYGIKTAKYREWPLKDFVGHRSLGFAASSDISRHRSNTIEVKAALGAPSPDAGWNCGTELFVQPIGY
jgi:hypothetical protein